MGKLLTGAILGGLGQAYFGFQKRNDEHQKTQALFDRQDAIAREAATTKKQEATEARWARGVFMPGEEEKAFAFDDLQAERAQRQATMNPQDQQHDVSIFKVNGGRTLEGGPKNMPKPPILNLGEVPTKEERAEAKREAVIEYAAEYYRRMKAQDNSLSDREIWQRLAQHNSEFADHLQGLVRTAYSTRVQDVEKRAGDVEGVPLPLAIDPQTMFPDSSFSNLIKTPLAEHRNTLLTPAHKEWVDSWKITEGSATTAGRAMGSLAAHVKGGKVRPMVQKLMNDRFVVLSDRMREDDTFTYEEWLTQMRQLMGGNPTEQQMLDVFVDASTGKQPFTTTRSLGGSLTIGVVNPSWPEVKNATARAKLHEQSSSQLIVATESIASVGSRANVEVTAAGENVRRRVSETVTKWTEAFRSLIGMNLDKDRTLNVIDTDIIDPDQRTGIRDNAFSDMEDTLRQLVSDGKISQATATTQLAKLREFKKGMAGNELDDETYLFNFQRVKLAYLYAKFIQGGGGGNAVSDADFQRNFDALFGQYSIDKDVILADMLKGIGAIHNDGKRSLEDARVRARHSYNIEGTERSTLSQASVQLYRKKHRATQDLLDQAGYQGVAQYWIKILHGGDASQASPLLRAMLRSSGRDELRRNVAAERGEALPADLLDKEGGDDTMVRELAPQGPKINTQEQQNLADSLAGGGSN